MDNFRWILLAVGILFIIIVYLISRKNKRDFYQYDDELSEDLPDISTTNLNDLDEGVGEVRVIARSYDDATETDQAGSTTNYEKQPVGDGEAYLDDNYRALADSDEPEAQHQAEPQPQPASEKQADSALSETVLVLYILAHEGTLLSGKSINSVAHANDMVFGDMSIYHRMDDNSNSIFSMVNMVKPGSFDPSTIHELTTPGISLFLQLPGPFNASDAFDDMLHTASRMSELLEASLCDKHRQPLTESVAEEYRKIAATFNDKVH